MTKILFLCSRDSSLARMAEGLVRARKDPGAEAVGATLSASPPDPDAAAVMAELGIDLAAQASRTLADLPALDFDIVITLCGESAQLCPILPGHPERIDWNLPNPADGGDDPAGRLARFRQARDALRRLVDDFFDRGYLAAFTDAKCNADLILDNIHDGIVAHDLNRHIFYFNRAAEEITGYSRAEVLNRDCHSVFPGKLCGGKCLFCDNMTPPENLQVEKKEVTLVTRGGESRDVEMSVKPMTHPSGKAVGVLVSFRDRTRERDLARRVGEIEHFAGIVGRDRKMLDVFDLIRELADSRVPVLIQGESGTGKELVAAAIHNEGPRADRLFVPVNCGALPEALLESELFGHVKGAFTGAIRDKKGRFELADGGTIFLDEIGDISPAMQVKLLRVLQEGSFERVGSEKTVKVDVRIISATNRNIPRELAEGRFRDDLYYRLNVVPLFLPALRERRNDIPLLAENILGRIREQLKRPEVTFAPEAMDVLISHDWPGNVRELQNWIQFAMIKCRDAVIRPEHLPPASGRNLAPPSAGPMVIGPRKARRLDIEAVRSALRRTGDNRKEAARILGISRATLYRFLNESGLQG